MNRFQPILLSASYSESSTAQNTTQIDQSVTTGEGDIFSLPGEVSVNQGGEITVINHDPQAAAQAIGAIERTTIDLVNSFTGAATEIVAGSNNIAAQVAQSQEQFVATASGQKYVLYAVAGVAALVILPALMKSKS
jgi:hypothetical protein